MVRDGEVLARGEVLDLARVRAETDARRQEIGEALERFAHNTIEHMREERELLSGKIEMPRFATDFRDRAALVVVRGVGHQRDLRALRPFIRDMRPVLIAVDGGAEALLEEGLRPDMIVGDMDSAGEATLMNAAGGVAVAADGVEADRALSSSCTPTPTGAPPAASAWNASACPSSWCRRPAPARTWRC